MLYDGVIRFSEASIRAIEENDVEAAHNALTRTQDIVLELLYGLDRARSDDSDKDEFDCVSVQQQQHQTWQQQ